MTDLLSLLAEHLAKILTGVATAGLIALFTYLYRRGSWTKEHRRARMYEAQGDHCFNEGLLLAAIEQYKHAMKIWEDEINQHRMLAMYAKVGCAYRKLGETERALEALTHCEMLWELLKKEVKIQDVYFELAQVHLAKNSLEKAAHYAALTVSVLRSQDSPRLPVALMLAARIARDRGRPEEAENQYVEAVRVLDSIGDILGLATIYYELGDLKQRQQSSEIAKQYYEKSADAFQRIGSARADEIRAKLAA